MRELNLKTAPPSYTPSNKPHFQVFGGNAGRDLKRRKKIFAGWCLVTMVLFFSLIIISQKSAERESSQVATLAPIKMKVLEPVGTIPKGTKLIPRFFALKEVDSSMQMTRYIHSFDEIADLYVKNEITSGTYLAKEDVTSIPPPEMLETLIPEGSRAISLSVDATTGVEGWAKPGVHVDVVISYTDTHDSYRKSQVVVQNAVVLSYNGQTEKMLEVTEATQDKDKKGNQVTGVPLSATVTLGVRSEDALQIRNSQMLGTISLLLRNEGDSRSEITVAISEEDFRTDPSAPPASVVAKIPKSILPPQLVIKDRAEGMVAYVDNRTGASIKREMINGKWQVRD